MGLPLCTYLGALLSLNKTVHKQTIAVLMIMSGKGKTVKTGSPCPKVFNNCTLGWFSEGWFPKISRLPYSDTVCFTALIAAHLYHIEKLFKGWWLRFSSPYASVCVPFSLLFPSHF